jgi:hypothetical protein
VSNLFLSLLIGVLVAGAVFVVAEKFRSLLDAGNAEFANVPGLRSLGQSGFENESQGQPAASNLYKQLGTRIAFAVPALVALFFLVWSHDALYDLFVAARGHAAALEQQVLGPADAGYAFSGGSANGTPISAGGLSLTDNTTVSGGSPGFVNHVVSGFAVPFREYRWHQPVEGHVSGSGYTWGGAPHGGVQWRPPAPSFPTVSSRAVTTMASRPRR